MRGADCFRRAWHVWSSHERRLNVDFLDTLAIGASLLQGNMIAGGAHHLADPAGRLGPRQDRGRLEAGPQASCTNSKAKTAWVCATGAVTSVPATDLVVDDAVVIYPGEMVPVDGEIIDGQALLDQKTITGEGLLGVRAPGSATASSRR